jgi:capsular polysaccharide biosynthesis protein
MKSDLQDAEGELREQIARLFAFVRRTLRFWPTVLIVLGVGALACVGFLYWNKPKYRSETVVLYSQGPSTGDPTTDSGTSRNVTVRLKELLMSRPKLERVVGEFNLYADLRQKLGMTEAVEELEKHVEYRAPGGDTFSIAFVGASPVEAQRVTSRLATLVIEQDAELRRNQARVTRDFLVTEKTKVEATLRAAERDLAAFMAENPRFALDVTPLATGAAIRATTAPNVAAAPGALTTRVFVPQAATSGAAPRPSVPVAMGVDSEVSRAAAAVAAARAHLAEQLEHYTEAHPDVRAAASAVERAESRLAALATGGTASQAPPAAPAAAPAAASGEPKAAPVVRRIPSTPVRAVPAAPRASPSGDVVALETEWLKLTRAATQARQRLDQVEAALFKADLLASSESGGRGLEMTVIDPAYLPARPLPPGRTLIVALFVAGSLLIGVFVAMLRAILDDRIFEARDALGPAELLVEVPRAGSPRRAHVPG